MQDSAYSSDDAKIERLHEFAQDLVTFRDDLGVLSYDLHQRATEAFQQPGKYLVTDEEWRALISLVGQIKHLVEDRTHQTAVTANRDLGISTRDVGKMLGLGSNTVARWTRKAEDTEGLEKEK